VTERDDLSLRTESLKTVYSEIGWLRRPWPDIVIRPGADELSANLAGDDRLILVPHVVVPSDWPDPRALGSDGVPFYRQVAELHRAFADDDLDAVRGFYATHGWLGDPELLHQRPTGERVGWCRHALAWFRSLVELTDILQNEADAALWRWFGACVPQFGNNLDLVRWSTPAGLLLDKGQSTIDVVPTHDRPWPTQRQRNDLYQLVWGAVIDAVQRRLAATPLEPIHRDLRKPRRPLVQWGFAAGGALDAAFLQWFFDVFAPYRMQICERPGCERRVIPPRTKFCSGYCADAHRQQRLRDRQKAAQASS